MKKKYEAPDIKDELKKDAQRKANILGKRQPESGNLNDDSVNSLKKKFKIDSSKFSLS